MDNSGELNRLVQELNEGRDAKPADSKATARLDQVAERARNSIRKRLFAGKTHC